MAPLSAKDTRILARQLGLKPCFTPVRSPQINGTSEAFVRMLRRDRVQLGPPSGAEIVLGSLPDLFEDDDTHHPHSELKIHSPREFIKAHTTTA